MLSVIRDKAISLSLFFGEFLRNEQSQVAKTTVMSIGSVLAVLAVAALPQTTAAGYPCNQCSGPCDPNQCSPLGACKNEPNCQLYSMPCSGGGTMYVKECVGGHVYCSTYCEYTPW